MNTVADQLVTLQAGGSYPVKAFFTNPLSKSLTNVMFHIEGAKLTKSQKISGRYAMASAVLYNYYWYLQLQRTIPIIANQ